MRGILSLQTMYYFASLHFALDGSISFITLDSYHVCYLLQREILSLYLKAIADLPFTSRQIYVHMHIYTNTHIYMNIYTHIHEYTQTHTFQGHLPYRELTKTVKNNRQS